MPKVDLSDEQVEELKSCAGEEIDRVEEYLRDLRVTRDKFDADVIRNAHARDVLREILEVLEDA